MIARLTRHGGRYRVVIGRLVIYSGRNQSAAYAAARLADRSPYSWSYPR